MSVEGKQRVASGDGLDHLRGGLLPTRQDSADSNNDLPVSMWQIHPTGKTAFFFFLVLLGMGCLSLIVSYYARAADIRNTEGTPDDHEEQIAELEPLLYGGIAGSVLMVIIIGVSARYVSMLLTCCGTCKCCVTKEKRGLQLDPHAAAIAPRDSAADPGVGRRHRGQMAAFGQVRVDGGHRDITVSEAKLQALRRQYGRNRRVSRSLDAPSLDAPCSRPISMMTQVPPPPDRRSVVPVNMGRAQRLSVESGDSTEFGGVNRRAGRLGRVSRSLSEMGPRASTSSFASLPLQPRVGRTDGVDRASFRGAPAERDDEKTEEELREQAAQQRVRGLVLGTA